MLMRKRLSPLAAITLKLFCALQRKGIRIAATQSPRASIGRWRFAMLLLTGLSEASRSNSERIA
jgi:hypothetical protein